jgi:nitrite reductase/ring-hydroxylating ferredoxin subunit
VEGDLRRPPLNGDPARPAAGTPLCALADLADPGAKGFVFRAGDRLFTAFVVRAGGSVHGWRDRCPHAALPLAAFGDRYLTREGDFILCANHGALFRIEDGLCIGGPCAGARLTPWAVRVEDGAVLAG